MNIATREADIFKALSEPIRLRMLVLLTKGELCVCDLTEILEVPQPTVSRHMGKLRQLSLVNDRRAGRWVHYRLTESSDPVIGQVVSLVGQLAERQPYSDDLARHSNHTCAGPC